MKIVKNQNKHLSVYANNIQVLEIFKGRDIKDQHKKEDALKKWKTSL